MSKLVDSYGKPRMPLLMDLFCGRWGWSKPFIERGWKVIGIDLFEPEEIPFPAIFVKADVLDLFSHKDVVWMKRGFETLTWRPDFICASSPCEQFSLHGMAHFHPNPPYPELGIRLFNHTRALCEASGIPYVMENVRPTQKFVGRAAHHCGPFYLWGSGVPILVPQGIKKGLDMGRDPITGKRTLHLGRRSSHGSKARAKDKAVTATIPPELASAVVAYAEAIITENAA